MRLGLRKDTSVELPLGEDNRLRGSAYSHHSARLA